MSHTKQEIDKLAEEIISLCEREMYSDTCVYWNNKRVCIDSNAKRQPIEDNINPKEYFKWAATKHILSMSFEGLLYDAIDNDEDEKLRSLLDKYGLYYELGNSWNLTVFPSGNIEDWEYTDYEKPKEIIAIVNEFNAPCWLCRIIHWWKEDILKTGDIGSCVVGAYVEFENEGKKYKLYPPSPYQGSMSWEHGVEEVMKMLRENGCTNVRYNCGIMD